jgi:hypothetical protein
MNIVALAIRLLMIAVLAVMLGAAQAASTSVTVHVSLRDAQDQPIKGIAIRASTGKDARGLTKVTDVQGHVDLAIAVDADVSAFYVSLQDITGSDDPEVVAAMDTYKAKIAGKGLKTPTVVPVVSGTNEYAVTIRLKPAVNVRGRLVEPAGSPSDGVVYRPGGVQRANALKVDGVFEMSGLPQGEPSALLICGPGWSQARLVTLTGSQTATNVDLGDVDVSSLQGSAKLNVTVTNTNGGGKGWETISTGLIAVKDDLTVVRRIVPASSDSSAHKWQGQADLPAGQYFLVCGVIPHMQFGATVSLLRSTGGIQRAVDLGLPRVTVPESGAVTTTVDSRAARAMLPSLRPYW